MITAQQMRAARALAGIDQNTLAERAGVSLPTIQRMEASDGVVRGVVDTLMKVIRALDEVRGERTTYGVVLRIGEGKRAFFVGYHGFSTRNQAIKSVEKNPQAAMASGIAVVAMKNERGLEQLIERVDAPPAPTGDWPDVYADVAAARAKRRGR